MHFLLFGFFDERGNSLTVLETACSGELEMQRGLSRKEANQLVQLPETPLAIHESSWPPVVPAVLQVGG